MSKDNPNLSSLQEEISMWKRNIAWMGRELEERNRKIARQKLAIHILTNALRLSDNKNPRRDLLEKMEKIWQRIPKSRLTKDERKLRSAQLIWRNWRP